MTKITNARDTKNQTTNRRVRASTFQKKSYLNPSQHNKVIYVINAQPKIYQDSNCIFIFMKISFLKTSSKESLFGVFDVCGVIPRYVVVQQLFYRWSWGRLASWSSLTLSPCPIGLYASANVVHDKPCLLYYRPIHLVLL